jgi:hypothetical protein
VREARSFYEDAQAQLMESPPPPKDIQSMSSEEHKKLGIDLSNLSPEMTAQKISEFHQTARENKVIQTSQIQQKLQEFVSQRPHAEKIFGNHLKSIDISEKASYTEHNDLISKKRDRLAKIDREEEKILLQKTIVQKDFDEVNRKLKTLERNIESEKDKLRKSLEKLSPLYSSQKSLEPASPDKFPQGKLRAEQYISKSEVMPSQDHPPSESKPSRGFSSQ